MSTEGLSTQSEPHHEPIQSFSQPLRCAARFPAQRVDRAGRVHIDYSVVLGLAVPLMAIGAVQFVLGLTDIWFIGRLSTQALAAVGAVQWLLTAIVLVLGGASSAVQTIVAQTYAARRNRRAGQAVWVALWATMGLAPAFVAVAAASPLILAPFGLDPHIESLATQFWFPRVAGAGFGAALGAMLAFFNGISQPRVTLFITLTTAITNAVFNELFMFRLDFGIAGSGWATTAAQAVGLLLAAMIFLSKPYRNTYKSHLVWRPNAGRLLQQLRLGLPMDLLLAADLLGFALFQMMQVRLGIVGGAATQLVMALTWISYIPAAGLALAGTTLVAQSIGAGHLQWAMRVGTRVIVLVALCMGCIDGLLALGGPWLLAIFAGAHDSESAAAVALGLKLLWLVAGYGFFEGLGLGASLCLRGAGDVRVPTILVLPVSWLLFLPLAHALTFAPGQGWVHILPQFGWGTFGGWIAIVVYMMAVGTALTARWHSGAWQRIKV
jgi:MATE family, multidrug efflux pump